MADDVRHGVIIGVHRFARLEIDVRVLRRAAHERVVRIERAPAMGEDLLVIDHRADLLVRDERDLVDLVRGAKAVEKMDEGYSRCKRRGLGDQRHVVGLLHRGGGEQRKAGRTHGHDVLMIAEDRQPLRRERAGGDMEDGRRQLARDLVHVRDHQEQALGSGEGGGQRATLEGAMHRARGAALALHLDHVRDHAPDIRLALRRPLIGQLRHGRARGDWVDRANLVDPVSDMRASLVAVHRGHGWGRAHADPPPRPSRLLGPAPAPAPSRWRGRGTAHSRRRSRCSGHSRSDSEAPRRA